SCLGRRSAIRLVFKESAMTRPTRRYWVRWLTALVAGLLVFATPAAVRAEGKSAKSPPGLLNAANRLMDLIDTQAQEGHEGAVKGLSNALSHVMKALERRHSHHRKHGRRHRGSFSTAWMESSVESSNGQEAPVDPGGPSKNRSERRKGPF